MHWQSCAVLFSRLRTFLRPRLLRSNAKCARASAKAMRSACKPKRGPRTRKRHAKTGVKNPHHQHAVAEKPVEPRRAVSTFVTDCRRFESSRPASSSHNEVQLGRGRRTRASMEWEQMSAVTICQSAAHTGGRRVCMSICWSFVYKMNTQAIRI